MLANDQDASGNPLVATLDTGPHSGSLTLNSDGSFTYVPNLHAVGVDTFSYHVGDGTKPFEHAYVAVQITDTAPIAPDDTFNVNENQPLTPAVGADVSRNDSDPEGDPVIVQLTTGPQQGTLDLNSDGQFVYTPVPGFFGTDNFGYTDSDGVQSSGVATVTLPVNQVIPTNSVGRAVVTADFNSDGHLDFAVANYAANTVSVFLNEGKGAFLQEPDVSVGNGPVALAAGDFNRDGHTDLAVVNSGSNAVSILLGNGNGTFTAAPLLSTGPSPSAVVVAAFTSSGFQDVAVTNSGSNTVTLFRGNGDGTFTSGAVLAVGTSPWRWRRVTSTAMASRAWRWPTPARTASRCCWATATAPSLRP